MNSKRIAITGAAHGLGKALAVNLAENGHTVYLADIDEAALNEITNRFENTHSSSRCERPGSNGKMGQ